MPEVTIDRIRTKLSALEPMAIELRDDSAAHVGHEALGERRRALPMRMVKRQFAGQSKSAATPTRV